jgi:hypothetical protein
MAGKLGLIGKYSNEINVKLSAELEEVIDRDLESVDEGRRRGTRGRTFAFLQRSNAAVQVGCLPSPQPFP